MAHGKANERYTYMISRRRFSQGLVSVAFSGLALQLKGAVLHDGSTWLTDHPLVADPNEILDLPKDFSYQVISKLGDTMNDGLEVPDRADGMGCFALDDERVVLVRNHELSPSKSTSSSSKQKQSQSARNAYDIDSAGNPLPGGTSSIVYNLRTSEVEYQCMTLLGTIRNCSGGVTPWGSWLSCEESVATISNGINKNHGYVFEVPASARGLVEATPLKAMGRFNHEAACVDPATGIVYMTEDRPDSLFYRFLPNKPGKLELGGKLQALKIVERAQFDTRNWSESEMKMDQTYGCEWLDLEDVESPNDDLRQQGFSKGAAVFARGEGIIFGNNEMYFCCTSGGRQKLGQVMRYVPSGSDGGDLSLFVESADKATFNYGDNLVVAPNSDLLVCEDQYSNVVENHIKGVTPKGKTYDFAKVRRQTEPAGPCFSPDGSVLFVNLYSPTVTLAITGPWDSLNAAS